MPSVDFKPSLHGSRRILWLCILIATAAVVTCLHVTSAPALSRHDTISPRYLDLNAYQNITERDTSWDDAVYHGNWLACIMNAPASVVTQSQWIVYNGLNRYGWTSATLPLSSQDALDSLGLVEAFDQTGIRKEIEQWTLISDTHDKDAPPFRKTGGRYFNYFNKNDGVIIASSSYGPDYYAARRGIPKSQIPPLKQWSDIVYLEWLRLAGRNVNNIQHVFRYNIANKNTQTRLRLAMGNGNIAHAPEKPGPWPGYQWNIDEDKAKVALTTSNSVGVSYFLAQHKDRMGIRVIDQVNIFNCKAGPADQWCLYFHIRNGPLDKDTLG